MLLIAGCAPIDDIDRASPPSDGEVGDGSVEERPAGTELPEATVDGQQVILEGPRGPHAVAALDPEDGTPRSAAVRPNDPTDATDSDLTIAVVVDSAMEPGPRYVLRYLHLDGGLSGAPDAHDGTTADDAAGTSAELAWLPWRFQIDAEHGVVRDVPPTLVWAPDGHRLAWIEWDEDEVALRLLDWGDDGPVDGSRSPLSEVPPGVELDRWVVEDGESVLLGERDGEPYRFELRELAHEPETA